MTKTQREVQRRVLAYKGTSPPGVKLDYPSGTGQTFEAKAKALVGVAAGWEAALLDKPSILDFHSEFGEALYEQLLEDEARWGKTWLTRPREGQEQRVQARYNDYFDMFEHTGTPVPWLKIVGNALIAWVREQHPELFGGEETE